MSKYYPTEDTFLNASRGLIKGGEVRNIFGYQEAADTTFRVMWEFSATDLLFPSSAIPLTVTSASGSDDGKSLLIKGLDANWNVAFPNAFFSKFVCKLNIISCDFHVIKKTCCSS